MEIDNPIERSEFMQTEQNVDVSDEESFNTMSFFELSQEVQKSQDLLEFNSTYAMMDPKTGRLACMLCFKSINPIDLTEHMIDTHKYRRVVFKCFNCNTTFQERKELTYHKDNYCEMKPKKIQKLNFKQILRKVDSKAFLDVQEDNATCPICRIEFSKSYLKTHLLNDHKKGDGVQSCKICNRKLKSKVRLKEHVRLVHAAVEDSAECDMCDRKFKSKKYLRNHKRNVHPAGNKAYVCFKCGKAFKSRLCLYKHTRHMHPPASAAVDCPVCHKGYNCDMNLRQHMRVTHGILKRK